MLEKDKRAMMELDDEQLDKIVGGVSVGDRVRINPHMITYCPGCARLVGSYGGEVMAYEGALSDGTKIYTVKMDCCGYETRAAEFVLTAQ